MVRSLAPPIPVERPAIRQPLPRSSAIDVVMPVHNEGAGVGATLREFHEVAVGDGMDVRFIVSEDGSTDDTCSVVRCVAEDLPVRLFSAPERKGYSRAVLDGLCRATAGLICFVDGDGQCDPADLRRLVDALGDRDLAVGYRVRRRDPLARRIASSCFGLVFRATFPVRRRDPSCPYLVVRREALETILRGRPGVLREGFWWEFAARAAAAGVRVVEVPVGHRPRVSGVTQVYRWRRVPRIALEHLVGLLSLSRELRALRP